MRVLIAVLALVATPVIASVAQAQGSTPPASVRQNCANDHRWQEGNHLGDKNASKQGCDPSGGGTGGTGVISGFVYIDFFNTGTFAAGDPGVAGWPITLTGPVSATTSTDGLGNYSLPPVPVGGPYTVCQSGPWVQTFPANNACYTVTVVAAGVPNLNFGLLM